MDKIYEVKLNKERDIPLYQQYMPFDRGRNTSAKQQTAVYT